MTTPEPLKPSQLKKNLTEYAIIALSGCVASLFWLYISLNSYVRDKLTETVQESKVVISKNSDLFIDIKVLLNQLKLQK